MAEPGATRLSPALAAALVAISGLLFAVNGVAVKVMLNAGLDPLHLTLVRSAGSGAGLLAVGVVLRPGPARFRVAAGQWPLLIAYGLTGFFLVPICYFAALSRLPVGIAVLFEHTAPLLVALWIRFGRRELVRRRLWSGLALALAGLGCVAEVWRDLRLDGLGIAFGLASATMLGVRYVLGARGVADRDPVSLTFWAFAVATVAGLVVRPVWAMPFGAFTVSVSGVPVWAACAYLVVFGSVLAYLLVAVSLRHLPATSVAVIAMVEPVIAAAVAWLVLGETVNAAQVTGAALVLTGVLLAETARAAGPPTPALDT